MAGSIPTSAVKVGWILETNYAGGNAGAKYAETASTTNTHFKSFNYLKGSQQLPKVELERENIRGVGLSANQVMRVVKGYRYTEITITQYLQDAPTNGTAYASYWLENAIATAIGAVPASFYIHYELTAAAGDSYNCFGCVLSKYKVDIAAGEWPTETLTFLCYEVLPVNTITDFYALPTNQPLTFKDFSTVTVAATQVELLKSISIEFTNELNDGFEVGKAPRMDPILLSRDSKVDLTFHGTAATTVTAMKEPLLTATATLAAATPVAIVVASFSAGTAAKDTLTLTGMDADTSNRHELPEKMGMFEYTVTFVPGGTTTAYALA